MKQTQILMGMPISVEIIDNHIPADTFNMVFDYFRYVDETFSTYKPSSEVSKINRGEMSPEILSQDMREILQLSEKTRVETKGYFNIRHKGQLDPSGIVKGWAINNAARLLKNAGYRNYYIDAGGDIQVEGKNSQGRAWTIGIRNPFKVDEIVKVLSVKNCGVATSGTYERGRHIYNPMANGKPVTDIVSITVIGPNIYDTDRFATAAFAMGSQGIKLIEKLDGFEGYMIDNKGIATMTKGFEQYTR